MGTPLIILITAIVSALIGAGIYVLVATFITKNTIHKQCAAALKEAEAEGEMIKKEKILQAKEKFIQLKSEHDRQVNERNQKIAQSEQRAKQMEANLAAQQRELDNKIKDNDRLKEQVQNQLQSLNARKEELAGVIREQNTRLEQISGMSADDAKNTASCVAPAAALAAEVSCATAPVCGSFKLVMLSTVCDSADCRGV